MKKTFFLFILLFSKLFFSQKTDQFVINNYLISFPKVVEFKNLNKDSGQYHFYDKNKSNILVSIRDVSKMEFYNSDFNKAQLIEAFYKWDYDYWKSNSIGAEVNEISKKLDENYILWETLLKDYDTIFLYGMIDNKIISLSINNDKLSKEKKVNYLTNLYQNISKYK